MRKLTDRKMALLLRNTAVTNHLGEPLIVYRGEHGLLDEENPGLQTRLGSLSFGSAAAASTYAQHPNVRGMTAESPRVYPAFLIINNPFTTEHDPFLDFSHVEKKLGRDIALHFFDRYADHAEHTDNWASEINGDDKFTGVREFLKLHPERAGELYASIYPFLDDPEFSEILKAKGFDGAIYGGCGENALEPEYRVFEESSVIYALSKEIALKPNLKLQRDDPGLAA